ncbi:glycosyltransferase family 2 protein [Sphingomonas sp. Tas61C01]|uniref:glycosyltransferase family 2 protein n=1 Tax=Sphingomonas sp. Tas61C01 TaxID=3458297 RepID=UPI00403E6DD5
MNRQDSGEPAPIDATGTLAPVVAVTVTYNSADVLDDFLASMERQHGDWSLIIVDNASTDGTRRRLERIDSDRILVILNPTNDGFAAGTNIGIRAALDGGATSVLLLNNDTVFEADMIVGLSSRLADSGADAISPVIVFDHDPNLIWYAGGHLDWTRGVKVIHEHFEQPVALAGTAPFETGFCPACCMLFTRSAMETAGLLDEDFFVYWEDAEHCLRMHAAGLKIVVTPALRIRHKASILTGGMMSDFSLYQQYKNRIILLRKAANPLMLVYSVSVVSAAVVGRYLFKGDPRRGAALRLKAVWAGIRAPLRKGRPS